MASLAQYRPQFFDNAGDPLSGGKVYFYAAGTTTPLDTYTDQGGGTPNANPVILDSAGRASIWIGALPYKVVVKTSADVALTTDDNINVSSAQTDIWCGTAGGTANALTLTPSPAISAYVAGQTFRFKSSANANTAAATVAVSGLAAKALQKSTAALAGGEIEASKTYEITYDGAAFQLSHGKLAASGGSALVGHQFSPGAAYLKTTSDILNGMAISVDRWLTQAQKADAIGGAAAIDLATPLQTALTSADSIYFPYGEYLTSAKLTLKDNQHLHGVGKIRSTVAAIDAVLQATGKSNVIVEGLSIYGTLGALPLSGIQLKTCTDSAVRNCRVRYASHEGISLNQSTYDCDVSGNLVRDISTSIGWGIGAFWDIQRCTIERNRIFDCGAYGIVLDDGTSGQSDNLPTIGMVVSGNVIRTSTTNMWGIAVEGTYDSVIDGNYIEVISTVGIDIAEGNSIVVFYPTNNVVSNNRVKMLSTSANTAIRLQGGSYNKIHGNVLTAGDIGVTVTTSKTADMVDNLISGNIITGCSGASSTNKAGIQVNTAYVKRMEITNNKIQSPSFYGIQVQAGTGIKISGNSIDSAGKEGILVEGAGTAIISPEIVNNRLDACSASAAGNYAGVKIKATAGTIAGALVAHNVGDDNGGSPTLTATVWAEGAFSRSRIYDNIGAKSTISPCVYISSPTGLFEKSVQQSLTGGAIAPSYAEDGAVFFITATSNVTIATPNHYRPGARITYIITQDATGGRTVVFDGGYKLSWSDAGNTASKTTAIDFVVAENLSIYQIGAQKAYT